MCIYNFVFFNYLYIIVAVQLLNREDELYQRTRFILRTMNGHSGDNNMKPVDD